MLLFIALIFGLALCIQSVGIRLSIRLGLLDQPTDLKTHARAVPFTGGIGIFLTLFLGALLFNWIPDSSLSIRQSFEFLTLYPIALAALVIVGFVDDAYQISPWARIVVQMSSTTITLFIPEIRSLLSDWSSIFGVFVWPLYFLFVTGVTNAFNLIDGRDGLAATTFLTSSVSLLILSIGFGANTGITPILALSAISVSGFLYFNKRPAKVFMGDSGSAPLGFLLATCSLLVCGKETVLKNFIVPLILLGYPILNMGWATIGRILRRSSPMMNDRSQLHDRMGAIFSAEKKTYGYLMTIHLIFQVSAISLFVSTSGYQPYLFLMSSMLIVLNVIQTATYAFQKIQPTNYANKFAEKNNVIPIRPSDSADLESGVDSEQSRRESA